MMFWYGGGLAFWQVLLMWLFMIAFWGLLIWGGWALITGAARRQGGQARRDGEPEGADARKILDGRLARGEIDIAEYQRLRDVIAASDPGRPAWTGDRR